MSNAIHFFVHGIPVAKGSVKAFMPKGWNRPILTSTSGPKLKSWAQSISTMALEARGNLRTAETGPIAASLMFYLPRPKSAKKRLYVLVKPDIDKLVRAVLDALSGILFHDDSQVIALLANKYYEDATNSPGVWITITSPGDEPSTMEAPVSHERVAVLFQEVHKQVEEAK